MLPTGAAAAPGRGTERSGEEGRRSLGVQEWADGSRYEGEFENGLKHGRGRFTWTDGEYYEGSFDRDFRHGDGTYCWPTGHKFTGKFYLNRKEGYGHHLFPDGNTFQGLYHSDQRFGPGVISYPDGRKDVGLWVAGRLLKLCAAVEPGFTLKSLPEYVTYMDPATTTDSLTKPPNSDLHTERRADFKQETDRDLESDENFILPPGIENYSTDGDHLPLPPSRRTELDRHFHGELWEQDAYLHRGYERDPLSKLPLEARMQAHIHKHRLQADAVGWDVGAVLSLNRKHFGPKGPLEVTSELLIQHASKGELQAVSQILQTGLVHPDVADSKGHTALIAATVNCHNCVIQLLLDMGADIDKMNCESMCALAVCHVLYYPFQSLHATFTEPPAKPQVLKSGLRRGNSPQSSHADFSTNTSMLNNRPQTVNTILSSHTNQSQLSDQTAEGLTEQISHHRSKVSNDNELTTERLPGLQVPESPADAEHQCEEEREETEGDCMDREREVREEQDQRQEEDEEETQMESRRGQTCDDGESELKGEEEELKTEKDKELGERTETESRKDDMEVREEVEEDVRHRQQTGSASVERSIQVLDGHIALGSVQWKAKAAETVPQGNDNEQTPKQTFDSACSVSSYDIQVTDEVMQRSAEALSRTGVPHSSDTKETVRKMAAMKIEHRVRLSTLKLLLERGADPNVCRIPMPVLFIAIMAADSDVVRKLLLCGARTDIPLPPERKGLYPLHVAAALQGPAGPRITEMLLHTIIDPDARACDQDEIYEPDKVFMKAEEPMSTNASPHLKEGGQTALHVACQRDNDHQNASKVVALLLSHRARADLLWSGHSPLSLAIATGNDLAVEELLKGGADPNILLGRCVGNSLCALANIHYRLGGNKAKMLDMLAKAGADVMMPVMVGSVVGTAVDYAHYSFSQDLRIATTPIHALNMQEKETLQSRRKLLSLMADLQRQTAIQREQENLEREKQLTDSRSTETFVHTGAGDFTSKVPSCLPPISQKQRKPAFKFCYGCGRSVVMKLTACSRCRNVFYCSRTCKLKAWNERHKDECIRVSAPTDAQRSVVFRSQRVLEPLTMAEVVLYSQISSKQNYSSS